MLKGDGSFAPGKTRWVMRLSSGTEFETTGYYSKEEVEEWECSRPVKPIEETERA